MAVIIGNDVVEVRCPFCETMVEVAVTWKRVATALSRTGWWANPDFTMVGLHACVPLKADELDD